MQARTYAVVMYMCTVFVRGGTHHDTTCDTIPLNCWFPYIQEFQRRRARLSLYSQITQDTTRVSRNEGKETGNIDMQMT